MAYVKIEMDSVSGATNCMSTHGQCFENKY